MLNRILGTMVPMLTLATPALAQQVDVERVSAPPLARWLVILLAATLVLLVIMPSFKNAKRSHQD
jgi:hypothetical protein